MPTITTADIEYDLGGATASTVVSVLATAPVLVEYLDAPGGSVIGSATIDNPGRVGYALMSGNPAAVKISATTFAADSGGIVYAWAGVPLRLEGEPASMTVRPAMAMERGQGLNPAARRIARGYAADIEYSIDSGSPHPLSDSDRTALVDLYEELKAAGDRPFG